jgi:hypothetical protein
MTDNEMWYQALQLRLMKIKSEPALSDDPEGEEIEIRQLLEDIREGKF